MGLLKRFDRLEKAVVDLKILGVVLLGDIKSLAPTVHGKLPEVSQSVGFLHNPSVQSNPQATGISPEPTAA